MSWQNIAGHDAVFNRFQKSFQSNRLATTFLFVGREGVGKRLFALKLAQALFCEADPLDLQPCLECPSCRQVTSESHPDLILISRPADKSFIPVEMFIGDREHRRRQGLCHDINLTPFSGSRKVAIIDDADYLNAESANSLLKTLEEPPENSLLILIGTSEHRQLPTILSRSQVVRFGTLSDQQVATILQTQELTGEVPLEELAQAAGGSVQRALELDDQALYEFRQHLLGSLVTLDPASAGFSKTMFEFVEGTSKEASVRRTRMKLIADFATQLYRDAIQFAVNSGETKSADGGSQEFVCKLVDGLNQDQRPATELIARLIDRTIEFQQHVDANMAMANIVPSWLNDLGSIARCEKMFA